MYENEKNAYTYITKVEENEIDKCLRKLQRFLKHSNRKNKDKILDELKCF